MPAVRDGESIPPPAHRRYLLDPEVRPKRAPDPAPERAREQLYKKDSESNRSEQLYKKDSKSNSQRRSPTNGERSLYYASNSRVVGSTPPGNLPNVRATRNPDRRRSPNRCQMKEETKAEESNGRYIICRTVVYMLLSHFYYT